MWPQHGAEAGKYPRWTPAARLVRSRAAGDRLRCAWGTRVSLRHVGPATAPALRWEAGLMGAPASLGIYTGRCLVCL